MNFSFSKIAFSQEPFETRVQFKEYLKSIALVFHVKCVLYTTWRVSRYRVFLVCIFPNGTEYGEIRLKLGFLKWKPVSTGLSQYSIFDIALSVASAITICFNNKQLEYLISIKTKFGGNVARHFLSITSI